MTQQMKDHVNAMLDGATTQPAMIWLGEDVVEAVTGRSRGEGSISVLNATRYTEHGLAEMLEINDEVRGYRGTTRKEDFFRILDAEEKLAEQEGRTLRFELRSRDRRALWQELNDDAARGNVG